MLYYTMCFFASEEVRSVLILVVLDDALVLLHSILDYSCNTCLNPCCAGLCSSTGFANGVTIDCTSVSQSLLCWTML